MSKHPKKVSVIVKNKDIQKALRIFKRNVNKSEHLLELRERRYYTKPTTKRRKQKQQAIREQQRINKWEKENL